MYSDEFLNYVDATAGKKEEKIGKELKLCIFVFCAIIKAE